MSTETIVTGVPAAEPAPAAAGSFWKDNLRDYGLLGSLLLIMAFFEFVTGGVLFRGVNMTNLILQNSYIVIMALGMLLIIVGGNIDLSVGSIVGFVGAIAATLMVDFHAPFGDFDVKLPWQLVIVLSLILGGAIGAVAGLFRRLRKIPSFIVTLAGMLIFRGLTGNMLLGQFVGPFAKGFQSISAGFIPDFGDFGIFVAPAGEPQFHWLSMVIGVVGAALLIFTQHPPMDARQCADDGDRAVRAVRRQELRLRNPDRRLQLPAAPRTGPAQRPDHHGRADPALHVRDHPDDDRTAHLCDRRQPAGGAAFRYSGPTV